MDLSASFISAYYTVDLWLLIFSLSENLKTREEICYNITLTYTVAIEMGKIKLLDQLLSIGHYLNSDT